MRGKCRSVILTLKGKRIMCMIKPEYIVDKSKLQKVIKQVSAINRHAMNDKHHDLVIKLSLAL